MSASRKNACPFLPWTVYLGAGIFAGGIILSGALQLPAVVPLLIFGAAYLLAGGTVLLRAVRNIAKGQVFDENFLMALASIGAFVIGEYPEGTAVMLFYQVGEAFQDLAVRRSRRSIAGLMDIRPDTARVRREGAYREVPPETVRPGEIVLVKPGEKIPLDGVVAEGVSALDTRALTGEALPRDVEAGDEVLSGSINRSGPLIIKVTKEYGESTVSKILSLVENAVSRKAKVENFITGFARYYTPGVVCAALALGVLPPLLFGADFSVWIYRALVFLVVSCPCALVISVPLTFFAGIGAASARGILIKGSSYLEALNHVVTVVFDKTGTLTEGVFKVKEMTPYGGFGREELLFYASHAEAWSSHPIALSVREAWGRGVDESLIGETEERAGRGICGGVNHRRVLAGNLKLMEEERVLFPGGGGEGTALYIAVDGVPAGRILIADELKKDSLAAVKELRRLGVKTIAMLTGDSAPAGEAAARELGLDRVYAGLLPQEKVEVLEALEREEAGLAQKGKKKRGNILFAGDGINDAPALARSDIGVAMGGIGSDAAIEAADVVLMTDEPSKLAEAIGIAGKTGSIVRQNIVFALGVKGIILVMGALGITGIWAAVAGDVGVAFIAILNAMRAMRYRA